MYLLLRIKKRLINYRVPVLRQCKLGIQRTASEGNPRIADTKTQ
jgi:hypothetical protein